MTFRLVPIQQARGRRVGVIDIGSNSIRLVVYEQLGRVPLPVINEKVLCGLGRDLTRTGRLNADGVVRALGNLARFKTLLCAMDVDHVDVLATAAVREASDGDAFVAAVKRDSDLDVAVISGAEEARLSAMGVLCGNPGADGVMGDLGGGSLELVGLDRGAVGDQQVTLPLGPFQLMNVDGGTRAVRAKIAERLDAQTWLGRYRNRRFYAVGGSWRSLAKVEMEQRRHPLRIIHQYAVPARELAQVASVIGRQHKPSLERLAGVSKRRLETLPYGALVMEALIERLRPIEVIFSAYGLREGHLFDLLGPEERIHDPLLQACSDVTAHLERFGHAERSADWVAPLFVSETSEQARLRLACGLLSDISWGEHPDYRPEHAMTHALRMPVPGLTHRERAYLAAALYARYGGGGQLDPAILALLSEDDGLQANLLGLALRLAHTLTGGATSLLERTWMERDDGAVRLVIPDDLSSLAGDVVRRRLDAVAKAADLSGDVVFGGETRAAAS